MRRDGNSGFLPPAGLDIRALRPVFALAMNTTTAPTDSEPQQNATSEPPPLAPLDERLVQAIWNEQLLKSDVLVTADGRPVRVFDPGQWNGEAGPDFRNADITIGAQRCRGDVEIHINASDWDTHGHQRDFDYNNVILHVVLYRDDPRAHDDLHNGEYVPRLVLDDFLEPDLATIRQTMAGEEYFYAPRDPKLGPGCHLEIARLTDGQLCDWLRHCARLRMESRIQRYRQQAASSSLDQALYQALMTSMGHRGGKTLFFLLARRAPLDDLRLVLQQTPPAELPAAIECILLNVAGLASHRSPAKVQAGDFLSDNSDGRGVTPIAGRLDPESAAYVAQMEQSWAHYGRFFSDRIIPPTRRWMTGIRPVNFPSRRIAGIGRFLAATDFHGSLVGWLADVLRASAARQPRTAKDFKKEINALAALFTAGDLSYWSHHYTIGGRPSKSPMALIGGDRALSVIFNAVLPIMLFYAGHMGDDILEKHLWRLHDNFPALQENTITRHMRQRLLPGPVNRPGVTFRFEAQNQALIHVFHECCANADLTCENCMARKAG
jgi:hypothetical protein